MSNQVFDCSKMPNFRVVLVIIITIIIYRLLRKFFILHLELLTRLQTIIKFFVIENMNQKSPFDKKY